MNPPADTVTLVPNEGWDPRIGQFGLKLYF